MKEEKVIIKNIIFDWSGVISDSCKLHYLIVNSIFKKFSVREISFEELRKEWEQPYMKFYNKYLPKLTRKQEKDAYEEFLFEFPKPKLYFGIENLLHEFKNKGVNMIIISSDPMESIFFNIKRYKLDGVFQEIYHNVYDKRKIAKEVVLQSKFDLSKTIFIGDTVHDIKAGKAANIKTGAVTWGLHCKERLISVKPDFLISNLKELRSIILSSEYLDELIKLSKSNEKYEDNELRCNSRLLY